MNIGKPYAVRISTMKQSGKDVINVAFGDNATALKNDKDGYYHFVQSCTDDGILSITRYPYKRNREDGFLKVCNGMVKVTNEHGIRLLTKYIGEYNEISVRPNTINGSPAIFYELSLSNRSNFTNMYARKSGSIVDIEEPKVKRYVQDKKKIDELYDKAVEKEKAPVSNEPSSIATIDEIMAEEIKNLNVRIEKLQKEIEPLLTTRLRLTRARECLKYNCEIQKGE